VAWNERRRPRTEIPKIPLENRPDLCSDEEFERKLWAETDRSLRRDPERWVVRASATESFSMRARGEDDKSGGYTSAARSQRALAVWERRRAAACEDSAADG
jgi:hypothetical protein